MIIASVPNVDQVRDLSNAVKEAQDNNTLSWVFFIIVLVALCVFAWYVIKTLKKMLETEQAEHRADLAETSKMMRDDRAEYLNSLNDLKNTMEKQSKIIDKQQETLEASRKYMEESTHLLDGQLKAINFKLDTLVMSNNKE